MLDHGQGLLSLYLHFSEIKVKEGDRVERGQLLGLSGATGAQPDRTFISPCAGREFT